MGRAHVRGSIANFRVCVRACDYPPYALPATLPSAASWVASQGGQSQEFLGVRECVWHTSPRIASLLQPGNPARVLLSRPFAETRKDVTALVEGENTPGERSGISIRPVASLISGYPVLTLALV